MTQNANQYRSALEVVVEKPAPTRMAQFIERDPFNLPNTLMRDIELRTELLEGKDRRIMQAKPVSNNITLTLIQRLQNI